MLHIAGARVARARQPGGQNENFITLLVSAIGLAFVLASPAEAAKVRQAQEIGRDAHAVQHRQTAEAVPAPGVGYQGGVMRGPLYNGQDYLGDDPDPNVRAFLIKRSERPLRQFLLKLPV